MMPVSDITNFQSFQQPRTRSLTPSFEKIVEALVHTRRYHFVTKPAVINASTSDSFFADVQQCMN
jgi:hypothetical protein